MEISPRKSELLRKSADMTNTIEELSKATLELKKIESQIMQKPQSTSASPTIVADDVDTENDNNVSYHHQWNPLEQTVIMTIDSLIESPPPPPPPPLQDHHQQQQDISELSLLPLDISYNDITITPGMTPQSISTVISTLSSKLDNVKHLENKYKLEYEERRYNLQESWEKVSTLRNFHITPLRCLIEEVMIEDIEDRVEKGRSANNDEIVDNNSKNIIDSSLKTTVSIADLQIIREKIRMKEKLIEQVTITETTLNDLRKQLSIKTDNLMKAPTDTTAAVSTMEQRKLLLAVFKDLEIAEKKYVSVTIELENVENDLAQALTKAMASTDINFDGKLQEENQVFNLYEVLSGQAKVIRMNGECAEDFKLRLQARLESLLVLDNQMQQELESKTESVQISRDKLKDIEAERITVELSLRTEEARLEYLLKQKNLSHPNSAQKSPIVEKRDLTSSRYQSPEKSVVGIYDSPDKLTGLNSPSAQNESQITADTRTPAQRYWGTPQPGGKRKGEATTRKETRVAVVDVIERLEQLAGEIENDEDQRKSGQRSKKPKSQVIDANKSILDVFDRQRKEVEELRQARKDQQTSGIWHSGVKSYSSRDKSLRLSDMSALVSPSTIKSHINDTFDDTINDTNLNPNNESPNLEQHTAEYSEKVLKLGVLLEKYRQRYNSIQDIEYCNPDTGIAMDSKGNSLGLIEISVLALRNLPPMKKLTSNTDPYIELSLSGTSFTNVNDSYLEGQDVDSSTMALGAIHYDDNDNDMNSGFARTICKYNCRHAEWREYININPVNNFNQILHITVKDSSKIGIDFDEVIGYAHLPLGDLVDQQIHNIRLKITPPKVRKASYNVKIDDNCNVQLKIRLFYSKQKLYYDKIMSLESQIRAELENPQTNTSAVTNTTTRKKAVDNANREAPVFYRDVVGLKEKNHKDLSKMKERNEWLDPSLYMSKRDYRLAQLHRENQKPKTITNPNPPKPPVRARSLSPEKVVKKQTNKISFQDLYLKGNNLNNENTTKNTNDSNNHNDTKCDAKPIKQKLIKVESTPTKNINMNIFKAAKFRSNELISIREFKPKQKDRFNGGKTFF